MEKKVIHVNASALKESSCFLRLWLIINEGYTSKVNSIDIEYGQSFHKFTQQLAQTGSLEGAMNAAHTHYRSVEMAPKKEKEFLTIGHLTNTCVQFYHSVWTTKERDFEILRGEDDSALVEQKFCIPYYADNEVEVLVDGTIDLKCRIFNGCYAIGDYKTTTFWQQDAFFAPYQFSTQLAMYNWAIRWYARHMPDGNVYQKMVDKRLGSFIYGVFLSSSKDTEFVRSPVYFYDDFMMKDFENGLQRIVGRIVDQSKRRSLPIREGLSNGSCRGEFGMCRFIRACSAPDEISFNGVLRASFKQQPYNPLSHK